MSTLVVEPVLDEAKIAGKILAALTLIIGLAVSVGVITAAQAAPLTGVLVAVASALVAAANYVIPVVRARKARELVTPLINPKTARGVPLVPQPPEQKTVERP
jgi:hypothetical protein